MIELEDKGSRFDPGARVTASQTIRLAEHVSAILEAGDSLRVYTIGRSGERHCQVYGSGVPVEAEAGFWLL